MQHASPRTLAPVIEEYFQHDAPYIGGQVEYIAPHSFHPHELRTHMSKEQDFNFRGLLLQISNDYSSYAKAMSVHEPKRQKDIEKAQKGIKKALQSPAQSHKIDGAAYATVKVADPRSHVHSKNPSTIAFPAKDGMPSIASVVVNGDETLIITHADCSPQLKNHRTHFLKVLIDSLRHTHTDANHVVIPIHAGDATGKQILKELGFELHPLLQDGDVSYYRNSFPAKSATAA